MSVLQPAGPALTRLLMILSRLAGHMEEGPDLDLGNYRDLLRFSPRLMKPRALCPFPEPHAHLREREAAPPFVVAFWLFYLYLDSWFTRAAELVENRTCL